MLKIKLRFGDGLSKTLLRRTVCCVFSLIRIN